MKSSDTTDNPIPSTASKVFEILGVAFEGSLQEPHNFDVGMSNGPSDGMGLDHAAALPLVPIQEPSKGRTFIFQLVFERGRELLTALKSSPCPSNKSHDEPQRIAHPLTGRALESEDPEQFEVGRRTRCKKRKLNQQQQNMDFIGHPAGRGCKNCYDIGLDCSLLEFGDKYPCEMCKEDRVECELLLTPRRKATCMACVRKKLKCSYTSQADGDHGLPCQQCRFTNSRCLAGPAKELSRIRLRQSAQRKDIARPRGGMATVREQHSQLVPTLKGGKEKASKQLITVKTKISLPICFDHSLHENSNEQCQWCHQPTYGIFGDGEREVQVLQGPDGVVHKSSGSRDARKCGPSRMCLNHTKGRVQILQCGSHNLRRIRGLGNFEKMFKDAVERLKNPSANGGQLDKWCSICPQLARWECHTASQTGSGKDSTASDVRQCGLLTCTRCARVLREFQNDLQRMLMALEVQELNKEEYPQGLRADIGCLKLHGPLSTYLTRVRSGAMLAD